MCLGPVWQSCQEFLCKQEVLAVAPFSRDLHLEKVRNDSTLSSRLQLKHTLSKHKLEGVGEVMEEMAMMVVMVVASPCSKWKMQNPIAKSNLKFQSRIMINHWEWPSPFIKGHKNMGASSK